MLWMSIAQKYISGDSFERQPKRAGREEEFEHASKAHENKKVRADRQVNHAECV